jgi:nucleoside-diphosphate-sugar epimerase
MAQQADTIIITGAAGSIGRALTRRLAETCKVVGLDLAAPKSIFGTNRRAEAVQQCCRHCTGSVRCPGTARAEAIARLPGIADCGAAEALRPRAR